MNIQKKDYTHIENVLDHAIFTYSLTGGYIQVKKYMNKASSFGHKTNFSCIQQPNGSSAYGFYLMHHMIEFRRDRQRLRMSSKSGDAEILSWATSIGSTQDHRIRAEFYHIQCELAQVIMKQVVEQGGLFYHGPMRRETVQDVLVAQDLDMNPFKKLGCFFPEYEDWNFDR